MPFSASNTSQAYAYLCWHGVQFQAQGFHDVENRSEFRIAVGCEGLAEDIPANPGFLGYLVQPLGPGDNTQGMRDQGRVSLFQYGVKVRTISASVCKDSAESQRVVFRPISLPLHTKLLRKFDCGGNIPVLTAFVAVRQQNNQCGTMLNKVHTVSSPKVNPHFKNTRAHRLSVAEIANFGPANTRLYFCTDTKILQGLEPFQKMIGFSDFKHHVPLFTHSAPLCVFRGGVLVLFSGMVQNQLTIPETYRPLRSGRKGRQGEIFPCFPKSIPWRTSRLKRPTGAGGSLLHTRVNFVLPEKVSTNFPRKVNHPNFLYHREHRGAQRCSCISSLGTAVTNRALAQDLIFSRCDCRYRGKIKNSAALDTFRERKVLLTAYTEKTLLIRSYSLQAKCNAGGASSGKPLVLQMRTRFLTDSLQPRSCASLG